MRKLILLLALLLPAVALTAAPAISLVAQAEPASGEYVMVVTGCDWGPAITKVILNTGRAISAGSVYPEDFSVEVTLNKAKDSSDKLGIGTTVGELFITEAYISDGEGKRSSLPHSKFITLETAYGSDLTDGDPFFHFPKTKSMSGICGLLIQNESLGLNTSVRTATVSPYAGQFTFDSLSQPTATTKAISLTYGWWLPPQEKRGEEKIPLILWFHGIAEGGSNPYLPLLGTKAAALISDKIQGYFPRGAAVLVPQCPTGWLESTTEGAFGVRMWVNVDANTVKNTATKSVKNLLGKVFIKGSQEKEAPLATVSYYTGAVQKMMQDFLDSHPQIDRDRIYVGGCSAGGFMTLNMCLQSPGLFAAAFPICEAFPDEKLTEEDIRTLAGLPLWFTHAKNDRTISPEKHDQLTVARLRAAGAKDLHYVLFDDVHDTSGRYEEPPEDEDAPPTGPPYQYSGHDSWIYVLNDECFDGDESLFAWLSRQKK